MTDQLLQTFRRLDREISALYFVLLLLASILVARTGYLVYSDRIDDIWPLLPPLGALVAASLVSRTANRVILHTDIARTDDRRLDIARTTHHLIAITKDLRARVDYVRKMMTEGGRPAIAFIKIAESIEARYEVLLERDAYLHLPGNLVDLITRMSGTIYGISSLAAGIDKALSGPAVSLMPMPGGKDRALVASLDDTLKEIGALIDGLFELRYSIDAKNSEKEMQDAAGKT